MPALDVLMPRASDDYVIAEIDKRYRLHKLWESKDPEALIEAIKNDVGFIISSPSTLPRIDGSFMSRFPNLKGVVNFGVGYDVVDVAWARAHHIEVTHTPNVLNAEVADFALGLLLSVVRQIPQADQFCRQGTWAARRFERSPSLIGRKMGILGLGRIGKEIARRSAAFGLDIAYHGRHKQDVPYLYYETFKNMAEDCDILMLVAPASPETHHIVNAEILNALGPDGIVVNVGRGSLIDQDALIDALEKKTILSAALDVFEGEPHIPERLKALPHVVLTPHIGSSSHKTIRAIGQLVLDNLEALMNGKPPLTPVPGVAPGPFV